MDALYDQMATDSRRPVSRANGNARRRITDMKDGDTDILEHILPRASNTGLYSARKVIAADLDDDDDDLFSPMQYSMSKPRQHSSMTMPPAPRLKKRHGSITEDSRATLADFGQLGDSDRDSHPHDDDSMGELTPQKSTLAVPRRYSSRPKNSVPGIQQMSALHEDEEKALAPPIEFDEVQREDRNGTHFDDTKSDDINMSSRPLSSATPPPIGNPRSRDIYSDFDGAYSHPNKDILLSNESGRESTRDTARDMAREAAREDNGPHRPVSRQNNSSREARRRTQTPRGTRAPTQRPPQFHESDLYEDTVVPEMTPPGSRDGRYPSPMPAKTRELREQRQAHRDSNDDYMYSHSDAPPYQVASRSKPASRKTYSDVESIKMDDVSVSRQSAATNSSSRMPDFFGAGIFQVVLHNPTTNHQLLKFSESRLCSENVEFLSKVEHYRIILNDLATTMATIHKDFISEESPKQIHAPTVMLKTVHSDMKKVVLNALPSMESIFGETQEKIEQMVFTEIYPRFVRHQLTLSAIRALASDRHRYQGLGDCFCLTNPNKADNPIVFASDGFVKVTGYARPEVIPRNCRFLQGSHTDRAVVRRLREGIEGRREVVELLLNYKKNGDPFWNLLYMAPLFDESGKLAFFIGGQVNCSTTIHSNADVMRVLSISGTEDKEEEQPVPKVNGTGSTRRGGMSSARKAILKAFGVHFDEPTPGMLAENAGMERKVLGRMEGRDLTAQIKEFYTAYSKYIVVRYDSFVINFYSQGLTEMLNPANTSGLIAGNDIFRFFRQNMTAPQNDYKARVRNALRQGHPISVELRLQTSRSALFRGDESFMSHWTPLKDDKAAVNWVVVTLAPVML